MRQKFEELDGVSPAESEFARSTDPSVTADMVAAPRRMRERNSFERDDGTPSR